MHSFGILIVVWYQNLPIGRPIRLFSGYFLNKIFKFFSWNNGIMYKTTTASVEKNLCNILLQSKNIVNLHIETINEKYYDIKKTKNSANKHEIRHIK
jgi:hypothetical protein